MTRLRDIFASPRQLFFTLAIFPVLAINLPANAWLFAKTLPQDAQWLAWGAAAIFESSIVAMQKILPSTQPNTPERRAAWLGLYIVVGLSGLANIAHDTAYFQPSSVPLATWLDSLLPGAAWVIPTLMGIVRPAILIVFSIVVGGPVTQPVTQAMKAKARQRDTSRMPRPAPVTPAVDGVETPEERKRRLANERQQRRRDKLASNSVTLAGEA